MSLYRKYRPQSFAHLVGQDHIKETLLNEIKHGHMTHAYLLAGPRGTGKTSTARLLAKALNCLEKKEDGEPCEVCEFCKNITEGNLIDVIEIDAASNRGIDEIRDLREKIKFAPTRAKTKVYIIDEVHMLTKEAFNALLKTLVEPPPNVYFILCTTEIHKILETIISRCQRFDFKRIDVKTIMTRLNYIAQKENIHIEDGAIELIAYYVQGGLRDAISLFEQMIFESKLTIEHVKEHLSIAGHHTVSQLCSAFTDRDAKKALRLIQNIHNEGYDLPTFQRELLDFLRVQLLKAIEDENASDSSSLARIIEIILETHETLRSSPLPQLPLEMATIKICGPAEGRPSESDVPQKLMGTKEATEAEAKTAATIKQTFEEKAWDLETVRATWPRVVEKIKLPPLKRSLVTSMVTAITDDTVTITFGTKFHLDRVNIFENKAKIEEAFSQVFGKKPKVIFNLEKIILDDRGPRDLELPAATGEDLGKQAMEIFGEEERN